MSDVDQPGVPAAPTYQVPADYEELKGYRQRYEQLSETLAPYVDDIRPIIENEGDREYWRTARKSRDLLREQQEPQMDPQFAPLVSHFEKQFAPVVEYATRQQQREADAETAKQRDTEAATKAALEKNREYCNRIISERPEDFASDSAGNLNRNMKHLIALAASEGLSIEDAWKEFGSDRFQARPKAVKPPTSLRGDAAAPGVPGESKQPKITSKIGLRNRLAANLRAGGMKG